MARPLESPTATLRASIASPPQISVFQPEHTPRRQIAVTKHHHDVETEEDYWSNSLISSRSSSRQNSFTAGPSGIHGFSFDLSQPTSPRQQESPLPPVRVSSGKPRSSTMKAYALSSMINPQSPDGAKSPTSPELPSLGLKERRNRLEVTDSNNNDMVVRKSARRRVSINATEDDVGQLRKQLLEDESFFKSPVESSSTLNPNSNRRRSVSTSKRNSFASDGIDDLKPTPSRKSSFVRELNAVPDQPNDSIYPTQRRKGDLLGSPSLDFPRKTLSQDFGRKSQDFGSRRRSVDFGASPQQVGALVSNIPGTGVARIRLRWKVSIQCVLRMLQHVAMKVSDGAGNKSTQNPTGKVVKSNDRKTIESLISLYPLKPTDLVIACCIAAYIKIPPTSRTKEDLNELDKLLTQRLPRLAEAYKLSQRRQMYSRMRFCSIQRRSSLFYQGERAMMVYWIINGRVRIEAPVHGATRRVTPGTAAEERSAGDVVGDIALCDPDKFRITSAYTSTIVDALCLRFEDYSRITYSELPQSNLVESTKILTSLPCFSDCTDRTIQKFIPLCQLEHFSRGQTILGESKEITKVYFLAEGECVFMKRCKFIQREGPAGRSGGSSSASSGDDRLIPWRENIQLRINQRVVTYGLPLGTGTPGAVFPNIISVFAPEFARSLRSRKSKSADKRGGAASGEAKVDSTMSVDFTTYATRASSDRVKVISIDLESFLSVLTVSLGRRMHEVEIGEERVDMVMNDFAGRLALGLDVPYTYDLL
ncbi:hypothetical protein BJ742DRAFT_838758 [Cladochytrium replicatum]|nr:hypothetical protein BJ742DRAFT_838758 [Cladochytrium replicatum]